MEDGDDCAAFMDTDEPAAAAARPPQRVSWGPSASFQVTPFVVTDEERQARTRASDADEDGGIQVGQKRRRGKNGGKKKKLSGNQRGEAEAE